jgi:NRAMP (natural resistance-associated macrophage protein)-like metal ion transporter
MVRFRGLFLAPPAMDLLAPLSVTPVAKTIHTHPPAKTFLQALGPGLITGAADDDPSGVVTYAQVGARFGFSLLWTMLFTFPLMAAMQEICARLGRITGAGIAVSLRKRHRGVFVYGIVALLCTANIFNLGADLAAIGASAALIIHGSAIAYAALFGIGSLLVQIFVPYRKYVRYLRWLTVVLFAYVAAAFTIHVPWGKVLVATFFPSVSGNSEYWMALVAVLGTTISPYLFFWQTSQEAEEVRVDPTQQPLKHKPREAWAQFRRIAMDTRVGMAFSNVVAFAIILTTAAALHSSNGATSIHSAADAAVALKPVAGPFAFALFAVGIIGTGLLAVPVLAGSAGYAVAEIFQWRASLESKPRHAFEFYAVISAATILGIGFNFLGLDPVRALYWSAVLNGLAAFPAMYAVMKLSSDPEIVGKFPLSRGLYWLGWIATCTMLAASAAFLISSLVSRGE